MSDAFDDDRRGHAAGGTHGNQGPLELAPLQFIEHGADQNGTGGADGMAQSDRAAIDVDLFAIDVEIADEFSTTTAKASLTSQRSISSS